MSTVPAARRRWLAPLMGLSFVAIWCTGYPAARIVVDHSGPFTALALRFALATLVFGALVLAARLPWPGTRQARDSLIVGSLQLALQFGGVYAAMQAGASAGLAALVIGTMPLAVSAFAWVSGEAISRRQGFGLLVGFAGVWLVLGDSLLDARASLPAVVWLLLGLVGISAGTLYQKRHGSTIDLRWGLTLQNAAGAALLLPVAGLAEGMAHDGSPTFAQAMSWLVLVNSVGGFVLLFLLIRHGAATQVAALFYLVPGVGALMGSVALGETLSRLELLGFLVAAGGVWLGTHLPTAAPARR